MTTLECIDYVLAHSEVRYATKSGPYLSGKKITPVGCVNHSLGVAQPSVDKVFESMNNSSAGWGVHAILGDFHNGEGRILITLPWDTRPWGCGGGRYGSWNDSRVQWEVCEPAGHTYNGGTMIGYDVKKNQEYFDRMWKMLVAFNVFCAMKFGYTVDKIKCHSEAYSEGYGTNHADIMHWLPKHGKSMDILRSEVSKILGVTRKKEKTQATEFKNMTDLDVVMKIGPMCTQNQLESGILASVTAAQFILESGYGKIELPQKTNNCFGMKKSLSGNTWPGSTWDGNTVYKKSTKEVYNGVEQTITAEFRVYSCVEDSIADHSAYLLGAKNDSEKRYKGLTKCKKPKKAIKIIKAGGYATDPQYVSKVMNIIKRYNLTQYDLSTIETLPALPDSQEPNILQISSPITVRVTTGKLKIRSGPGTDYPWIGSYTGVGTFTIVDTSAGVGSDTGWGLLLSYSGKRNGWISMDYATVVK